MSSRLSALRSLASFSAQKLQVVLTACLLLGLAACQQNIQTVGKFPDPADVEKLKMGQTTRSGVAQILGTPSHTSNFSDNHWYYISQKQDETIKFRSQKIQQVVLVLSFDEQGLLSSADAYQMEDGVKINPSKDRTATFGRNDNVFQEILGSIGRIGGKKKSTDK